MSIPSTIHPVFAFVYTIWSSILRLVHSFTGLFSFNNRSTDANTTKEGLTPRHNLRPIVLTQRNSVVFASFSPGARTGGKPSPVSAGQNDNSTSPLTLVFQDVVLQRTSPRDITDDAELGLSTTITPITADVHDQPKVSAATTIRPGAGTPDTPSPIHNCSMSPLFLMPLTPPDRCYFSALPSANDYLYREPWPININIDRNHPRKLQSSPLKMSFGCDAALPESMVRTWDSPARGSPVQIWTSTPREKNPVHEMCLGPFGAPMFGAGHSSLADTPPLKTTHRSCIVSIPSTTSSTPSLFDISVYSNRLDPEDNPAHTAADTPTPPANENRGRGHGATQPRTQAQPSTPGVYMWQRHGTRLPGKSDCSKSYFHSAEWYSASAYVSSPVTMLSPPDTCRPLSESESESEFNGSETGFEAPKVPPTSSASNLGTSDECLPAILSSGGTLQLEGHIPSSSGPGVPIEGCNPGDQCVSTPRPAEHNFQKENMADPGCDAIRSLLHDFQFVARGVSASQVEDRGGAVVAVPEVV
ncbi:hypothetical protein BS17DRAFT_781799 [Gyrodon lividus]|nr:hypothetical protein BS17DRAFT_781799 [Gyrodon lividus]